VFGCTLQEYVGTAQLAWASAIKCAGRFDLSLFDTPDGKLIARHLSRDTVTRVLDAHFATTTAQFRAANEAAEGRAGRDERLRRYTYNPLRGPRCRGGFGRRAGWRRTPGPLGHLVVVGAKAFQVPAARPAGCP
jgi:hypothetical protein